MDAQQVSAENLRRKLGCVIKHIHANLGVFTPDELEEMVREKLIEAKEVPAELRTDYAKWRIGLSKRMVLFYRLSHFNFPWPYFS